MEALRGVAEIEMGMSDIKYACAVLVVGRRYALQLRDENAPTCKNEWGLFSGTIEPGEDPRAALDREIREELEIDPVRAEHLIDIGPCRIYWADVTQNWPRYVLHEGADVGLFYFEEVHGLHLNETTMAALTKHHAQHASLPGAWETAWRDLEAGHAAPDRLREVRVIGWPEFRDSVRGATAGFVRNVVSSLFAGDAWLIKRAFDPEFMRDLIAQTSNWTDERPESFHKMLEGSPDFHRMIDIETGKKYSIWGCKHSAYFYRWNDDPLDIWPEIDARWRVVKTVMGLEPREYETFTPKHGIVDRIQVVRYPPGIGYLEPHRDAAEHQRCFFSGYMSKEGVDYNGGGFYFVDAANRPIFLESQIDVGDICIGHANLMHGVAPCDRGKPADWQATDGRWFLSLYSNASDEYKRRHTAKPVKVSIPEVMP